MPGCTHSNSSPSRRSSTSGSPPRANTSAGSSDGLEGSERFLARLRERPPRWAHSRICASLMRPPTGVSASNWTGSARLPKKCARNSSWSMTPSTDASPGCEEGVRAWAGARWKLVCGRLTIDLPRGWSRRGYGRATLGVSREELRRPMVPQGVKCQMLKSHGFLKHSLFACDNCHDFPGVGGNGFCGLVSVFNKYNVFFLFMRPRFS
jgi:hypothetical protein